MEEAVSTRHSQKITLKDIPIEKIKPWSKQPRKNFAEEGMAKLTESIKEVGFLIHPILVRPLALNGTYEIIAGERRWRAAQRAGLHVVSCNVGIFSDQEALKIAIIENDSREDLNPIEFARSLSEIIEKCGYTHGRAGELFGKERSQITNTLRLLDLKPEVQKLLINGELLEGHGKILAGVKNIVLQHKLAVQCVKQQWSQRTLDKEVKKWTSLDTNKALSKVMPDPNLSKLERDLSDHFGQNVKVCFNGKGGEMRFPFKDLDHFEMVLKRLGFRHKNS